MATTAAIQGKDVTVGMVLLGGATVASVDVIDGSVIVVFTDGCRNGFATDGRVYVEA